MYQYKPREMLLEYQNEKKLKKIHMYRYYSLIWCHQWYRISNMCCEKINLITIYIYVLMYVDIFLFGTF